MKYIQFNQSEIQSTLEYWTDERMASAIPIPLQQVQISEIRQQKNDEFSKTEAEMSFCAAEDKNFELFANLNGFRVNMNSEPYKKAGILYMLGANGKPLTCTAQFVGAPNILLTAAHCIKASGGGWSTKIMFMRARSNAACAQTLRVAVSSASIHTIWDYVSPSAHTKWDYAFLKTTPDSNVGFLELSLHLPKEVRAIGYPRNQGNMRRYMYEVHGSTKIWKDGIVCMDSNFMRNGASGGAWFPRNSNQVVGLQGAHNIEHNTGEVFGPVFDGHTLDLFQRFLKESSRQHERKRCVIL